MLSEKAINLMQKTAKALRFSQIIGLTDIKQTLVASVQNNHVAHAQLFLGGKGSGNLALALAYATYLNCTDKQADDSCGKCSSCTKFDKFIHPDLHFVFPTSTTKKVSKREEALSDRFLAEWRAFLHENPYNSLSGWAKYFDGENKQCIIPRAEAKNVIGKLAMKSFEAEYKVMLIWLPETMQAPAANAILKILEEPPVKTLFLLVSQNADQLLPTILSRTQIIKVRNFSDDEICQYLEKEMISPQRAKEIAYIADGDLAEALSVGAEIADDNFVYFQDWMRLCFKMDFKLLLNWGDKFQEIGKEAQKNLLQFGLSMLREALLLSVNSGTLTRLEKEQLAFIQNFSKFIHKDNIELLTHLLNEAAYHLERNANPKITFLNLSIKIGESLKLPKTL